MTNTSTYMTSLYRLGTPQTCPDLSAYIAGRYQGRDGFVMRGFTYRGLTGLLVTGVVAREQPGWAPFVESLTGLPVGLCSSAVSGVVLLRRDRTDYALSFGMGHYMIDSSRIDPGFALGFAVRCLDEDGLTLVRRHLMDPRGRTDQSAISSGTRIRELGIERAGVIVNKIIGAISKVPLTHALTRGKAVRVQASDRFVKLPLAAEPEAFGADLDAIEEVCLRGAPLPELAFIEDIRPLPNSDDMVCRLDIELDRLLGDPSTDRLALVAPGECIEHFADAAVFRVTRGSGASLTEELELENLVSHVRDWPAGDRLRRLKTVYVELFADIACTEPLSDRCAAHRWLSADVRLDGGRYFYHQGRWYEIGAEYLSTLETELRELLDRPASVTLPPWPAGIHEDAYNAEHVAVQNGYVLFDRKTVRTSKFRGGGLEACDVLGPQGQLIHVKQAKKSTADLNHLFAQGAVAMETLRLDREVREKFLAQLAKSDPGRVSSDMPANPTVVFAILLKDGVELSADTLFPFAQVSLLQSVRQLQTMGASVEIVSIKR
jgi:uncharacterized protein (TIGR04141 family)